MNMKTRNKIMLLALCMVALIAVSVLGTMAYLTSTKTVTNTFTVGNVAIKLDETKVTTDGSAATGNDSGRTESGNEYKLMPGHSYIKDPTVTVNAKSEESYVRMLVTINEQADLDEIFKNKGGIKLNEIFKGTINGDWVLVNESPEIIDDKRTYEFRYKETVKYSETDTTLSALFKTIEIPSYITGEQLAKLADLKVEVVANAIQADGFKDEAAAWAAFDTQK